jgi:hypothetical protein
MSFKLAHAAAEANHALRQSNGRDVMRHVSGLVSATLSQRAEAPSVNTLIVSIDGDVPPQPARQLPTLAVNE